MKQIREGLLIPNGAPLWVEPEADVLGLVKTVPNGSTRIRMIAGEVTLDGSNPTSVVTGLSPVRSATVTLKSSATPGDDPVTFTVDYGGAVPDGQLDIYAWKHNGTDPTLIASTNSAAVVNWVAYGS
jgi:hypothetical protein